MEISFAVADVCPGDGALPKSEDEFFSGKIAPAPGDVAFVFDFVEDDRLSVSIAVEDSARGIFHGRAVLDAGVSNPWTRVIEKLFAVVNGEEVVIGIGGGNNLAES